MCIRDRLEVVPGQLQEQEELVALKQQQGQVVLEELEQLQVLAVLEALEQQQVLAVLEVLEQPQELEELVQLQVLVVLEEPDHALHGDDVVVAPHRPLNDEVLEHRHEQQELLVVHEDSSHRSLGNQDCRNLERSESE